MGPPGAAEEGGMGPDGQWAQVGDEGEPGAPGSRDMLGGMLAVCCNHSGAWGRASYCRRGRQDVPSPISAPASGNRGTWPWS